MTSQPWTIRRSATLVEAHRLMESHHIRHLPVVEGSKVIGIVSERDLFLLESVAAVDLAATRVNEAMTSHPFTVTPDAPVDEIVAVMAERKLGSVIVTGKAGIEGIFTAVDACRVLAEILSRATA